MIANAQLKDVVNKEIEWLWKPLIPLSKVTMIQGDTNVGKTNILLYVMSMLSRGDYPPTLYHGHLLPVKHGEPVKIYYVSRENGIDDTVAPFFDIFGGDRSYVEYQNEKAGHFILSGDEIRECVRITGAKLIVVDPWQQFIGNIASSDNGKIRTLIADLQDAAEETGVSLVLAGNYTKQRNGDILSGIGASEIFNSMRSILTVKAVKTPIGSPSIRILTASKMSFKGKETTPVGIRQIGDFGLELFDYQDWVDNGGEFDDEIESGGMDGMDGIDEGDSVPLSKADEAVLFLKSSLKDGPLDSREIKKLAKEAGISMPTINRIKKEAGVVSRQQADRSSLWSLER